ncbi:MAG: hypothetical protein ACRD2E_08815 [Terriglobales bacterium]
MRFSVNLARTPGENRRRAWVLWGGGCGLAAAALAVLAAITLSGWSAAASVRTQTAVVQARMAPLRRERAQLMAEMQRPDAQAAMRRAAYLNQLIDRKAVSWTRLFERLEALLPAQVQLLSVRPAEEHRRTALMMEVAAPSVPAALPFLHQLEEAPDFASPQVTDVSRRQRGPATAVNAATNGPVRLAIVAFYQPQLGPAIAPDLAPPVGVAPRPRPLPPTAAPRQPRRQP